MSRSCWHVGSTRRSRIDKLLGDGRLRGSWRHGALAGILSEDQEELEVAGKKLAYTDSDNSSSLTIIDLLQSTRLVGMSIRLRSRNKNPARQILLHVALQSAPPGQVNH